MMKCGEERKASMGAVATGRLYIIVKSECLCVCMHVPPIKAAKPVRVEESQALACSLSVLTSIN